MTSLIGLLLHYNNDYPHPQIAILVINIETSASRHIRGSYYLNVECIEKSKKGLRHDLYIKW